MHKKAARDKRSTDDSDVCLMPLTVEPVIVLRKIVPDEDLIHFGETVGEAVVVKFIPFDPEYLSFIGRTEIAGERVRLVEQDNIAVVSVAVGKLLDTAEYGIGYGEAGFLIYLAHGAFHERFTGFDMSAGKGDARPAGIDLVLHEDSAAVIYHYHGGQNNRFTFGHVG